MRIKTGLIICLTLFGCLVAFSQEALLSTNEQYYDFLALEGDGARPYINYRTLSDSSWSPTDETMNIWKGNNLGSAHRLSDAVSLRIYGPELYSSYNGDQPYGQNDGALWQGRGLNASLTGGARLEAYGFELTFKPQLTFSQNLAFPLLPSAYASPYGYYWGSSYNVGADAPQRFGDQPLYGFSWGDSEIRYTWKTLTVGFGTQEPWVGPGQINSIIHSNNAPPYPKVDLGLRKTSISPFGWYAGDIEARLWAGQLTESDYFDGTSGIHTLISGLALGYAPGFLPGLSLSFNRTYLAAWEADSLSTLASLALMKFNGNGGQDNWDQRLSIGFDYLLPSAGFEVYGEVGYNDNPGGDINQILRNFSHTAVYTGGLRKSVGISAEKNIKGELVFEWSNLEMSSVYSQFQWANSFYMHSLITQGYTNEGQWLGAGTGTGGNSQYLGFNVYFPKGSADIYVHRYNPDNDFVLRFTTPSAGYPNDIVYGPYFKVVVALGVDVKYFVMQNLALGGGVAYVLIEDPLYTGDYFSPQNVNSYRLQLSASYNF